MSITLKNPFVGNFLLKLRFEENDEVEKYYISKNTVIFYNKEYLERFNNESLKHLMFFTFFFLINRLGSASDDELLSKDNFLSYQISLESCINSYIETNNIAKFDVDGMSIYKHYKKKLMDYDHNNYYSMISTGIITIGDGFDLLMDFKYNSLLENMAGRLMRVDMTGEQIILNNLSSSINLTGGVDSKILSDSLSKMPSSSFFDFDNIKSFIKVGDAQVDWKSVVKARLSHMSRNDYILKPVSNFFLGGNIIPLMPRQSYSKAIDVAIAVDISTSVSEDVIRTFINEIFKIASVYSDYKIKFWTFGSEVDLGSYIEFDSSSKKISDSTKFNINIGGGTFYGKNWDFMKERDIVPDIFILFTDGMPADTWGDDKYCDTIFIILDEYDYLPKDLKAPFGKTLRIKNL